MDKNLDVWKNYDPPFSTYDVSLLTVLLKHHHTAV